MATASTTTYAARPMGWLRVIPARHIAASIGSTDTTGAGSPAIAINITTPLHDRPTADCLSRTDKKTAYPATPHPQDLTTTLTPTSSYR